MIERNSLIEVTYPIYRLNDEKYLIGISDKFQIRNYSRDELIYEFEFNECNFSVLIDNIFFNVDSSLLKYDLNTGVTSTFFKAKPNNEIWFLNESYLFEAKRTEVRREFEYSFYNTFEKRIKWTEKSTKRLSSLSNVYLLFTDISGSVLERKDIENGAVIWALDFSENKIIGKPFLLKNIITITTSNQDLIGIEIETGKELWRLSNCNLHHQQQQPNTNYLVGLSANSFGDNFYQVIDPISGKKIVDKIFENFFYETTPNLACITETHYYFISNVLGDGTGKKSERQTHLGCINLQSHEIEWIEQIGSTSDRRSSYQKPEINGNKIYLLDGEKTLHIYELEK